MERGTPTATPTIAPTIKMTMNVPSTFILSLCDQEHADRLKTYYAFLPIGSDTGLIVPVVWTHCSIENGVRKGRVVQRDRRRCEQWCGEDRVRGKMMGLTRTNGRERSKAGRPGNGTDCSEAGLKEAPVLDADMSPQGLDGHRPFFVKCDNETF